MHQVNLGVMYVVCYYNTYAVVHMFKYVLTVSIHDTHMHCTCRSAVLARYNLLFTRCNTLKLCGQSYVVKAMWLYMFVVSVAIL